MDRVLVKPVSIIELQRIVRQACAMKHLSQLPDENEMRSLEQAPDQTSHIK
jgi:hypothetical protein